VELAVVVADVGPVSDMVLPAPSAAGAIEPEIVATHRDLKLFCAGLSRGTASVISALKKINMIRMVGTNVSTLRRRLRPTLDKLLPSPLRPDSEKIERAYTYSVLKGAVKDLAHSCPTSVDAETTLRHARGYL
jgi:hypothetical protein